MRPDLTISTFETVPRRGSLHCREETMSSLESITASSTNSASEDNDDDDIFRTPTNYQESQRSIHILSCSSPEIRSLCKKQEHTRDDSWMSGISLASDSHIPISPCGTSMDDGDLEGLSESLSKIEFFTPERTAISFCSPDLKKPTRHRRVSYDILPSMKEIEDEPMLMVEKPSPLSTRHRRNTTQMMTGSMW